MDVAYDTATKIDVDKAYTDEIINYEILSEYTVFTTTARIHPGMPEFTFHRIIGDYIYLSYYYRPDAKEVSIIIEDENGNIIQEITELVQGSRGGLANDWYQLTFADYNFDGFLDMHLVRYTHGGASHSVERYFWLWDNTLGQFVENTQLPDITDAWGLYANQETRLIEVSGLVMGNPFFQYHFEYANGKFIRVARDEYWTQGQIHPDMPLFTFRRILGDYLVYPEHYMGLFTREVTIIIKEEDGNIIQEITGLVQESTSGWLRDNWYDITLVDYNFDGYLDMSLVRFTDSGTGMFVTRYVWLWSAELGQFVENEQLAGILSVQNININQETHQIEVWARAWVRHHFLFVYEYHNGQFVRVLEEEHAGFTWYLEITRTDHTTDEIIVELQPFHENISATNPPDEIFMTRVEISPDMPPLVLQLDVWEVDDIIEVTHRIDITIRQDDIYGTFVQEISGLEVYETLNQSSGNPFNLHFADYNQDGYLDMALRRWPSGVTRNDPHFYWLWDVQAQHFILNDDLTELSTISTISIKDDGVLRALHRLSTTHSTEWILVYTNGTFDIIYTED